MTPRERQLAAIHRTPADRVSVDAMSIENAVEVAALLNIAVEDVPVRLGLDGRRVTAAFSGRLPRPELGGRANEWGTINGAAYATDRPAPLAHAESVAEVERFAWPDPDQYDYSGAAATARKLQAQYAIRGPEWKPIFCRTCDLFGMERALEHMLCEPAVFEAAMNGVMRFTEAYCERYLRACGDAVDIFNVAEDFATQRGLLMSPEHWRRFLKPYLSRLFAMGKRAGKPVWFHSCGDITPVLPDLIDMGMDVWETVQLHTLPMSPKQLKDEYGKDITFFGAINTQRLPFWTPGEVRDEVRRVVDVLGKGGGYICGPDHHVKPDVPAANAVALFDAAMGRVTD